jgi:hypothetical protein
MENEADAVGLVGRSAGATAPDRFAQPMKLPNTASETKRTTRSYRMPAKKAKSSAFHDGVSSSPYQITIGRFGHTAT